jgi:hypothetical protein
MANVLFMSTPISLAFFSEAATAILAPSSVRDSMYLVAIAVSSDGRNVDEMEVDIVDCRGLFASFARVD